MRKGIIQTLFCLGIGSMLMFQSCEKDSTLGTDNNSVIKFPYSLFAATQDGTVINTNNGEEFEFVFPPDGFGPTQLVTSGNNLLMVKDNLHMSTNQGKSFNPVFTQVRKFPWQTMVYNNTHQNKLFVSSYQGKGVFSSKDHGATWQEETFVENIPSLLEISSFSGLDDGKMFAYSNMSNIMFVKDNADAIWTPVTTVTFLPTTGSEYYLTSAGNTLYLTDYYGQGGIWMSTDYGYSWERLNRGSMQVGDTYTSTVSPYGNKIVVVSTLERGIYRSDEDGIFRNATFGLATGTKVYRLTKKLNIYKNDLVKIYIYAATSTGIYRSEDTGKTWVQVGKEHWSGDYISIY